MARTKNRNQELKIARQAKAFKNQSKKKKDILFILSLFFTGFPYFTTAILFLLNGIIPPKYHEVKILLPEVIDALNKFAQISVENAWNDMPDHSVVTIDGSWNHKRCAKVFILDLICEQTHKIVDSEILYKTIGKYKGNYDGSSNLMESEAFKKMLPKLIANCKIDEIVKDGDLKISKIIKDSKWNVLVREDTNHKIINIDTIWNKWNSLCDGKLTGLKKRIVDFLTDVLYESSSTEAKLFKFQNAINHFRGNHLYCPSHKNSKVWGHRNDKVAVECLRGLITELSSIIINFKRYHTTNYNENFHSIKARLALKNDYQGIWAIGRILAAILQYNNPNYWIFQLMDYFHISALPFNILKMIYNYFNQRNKKIQNDHTDNYIINNQKAKKKRRDEFQKEQNTKNVYAHPYKQKRIN